MSFIYSWADIKQVYDNLIGYDKSLCREELRSLFQLVYFEFPPQPFKSLNSIVLTEPRRGRNVEIEPNVLQSILLLMSHPHVTKDSRKNRPHLPMLIVHLVAHCKCFQEHQAQYHPKVSLEFLVVSFFFATDCKESFYSFDKGND